MVPGVPEPKGSHFAVRRGRFNVIMNGGNMKAHERLKDWSHRVKHYSEAFMRANRVLLACDEPICADLTFYLPRPKSVSKRRVHVSVKPDVDKLVRGAIDPMVGVVITEDSRIVELAARKVYADVENPPGCLIRLWSV